MVHKRNNKTYQPEKPIVSLIAISDVVKVKVNDLLQPNVVLNMMELALIDLRNPLRNGESKHLVILFFINVSQPDKFHFSVRK